MEDSTVEKGGEVRQGTTSGSGLLFFLPAALPGLVLQRHERSVYSKEKGKGQCFLLSVPKKRLPKGECEMFATQTLDPHLSGSVRFRILVLRILQQCGNETTVGSARKGREEFCMLYIVPFCKMSAAGQRHRPFWFSSKENGQAQSPGAWPGG